MSKRRMLLCLVVVSFCVLALTLVHVERETVVGGASTLWNDVGYGVPGGSLGQNMSFGVGVSSWLGYLEVGLTAVIAVSVVCMAFMMYRFRGSIHA